MAKCMNCDKALESIDAYTSHVGPYRLVLCKICDACVTAVLESTSEIAPVLYRVLMGRRPDA